MALKSIEKIKVGSYPEGQFAGGYIYSINIQQGYSENMNKLTIDVVFDTTPAQMESNLPSKNVKSSYLIKIGDLTLPKMYFIEHSLSISNNQKILTCVFVDGSVHLDRYYVGLRGRHGTNSSEKLLILGTQLVGENCTIGDIVYSFAELIATINSIGIKTYNTGNAAGQFSYTGTIRQVLSNIGSDGGFSFYWDIFTDSLVFTTAGGYVATNEIINSILNDSGSVDQLVPVIDLQKTDTLEGSFQKGSSSFSVKTASVKENSYSAFIPIRYECVSWLGDMFGTTRGNAWPFLGRNAQEFLISCALAAHAPTLRLNYNLNIRRFRACGLPTTLYGISEDFLFNVFSSFYNEVANKNVLYNLWKTPANNFINKAFEEDLCRYEAQMFNDLYGKYYAQMTLPVVNGLQICRSDFSRKTEISSWPENNFGSKPWIAYGAANTTKTTAYIRNGVSSSSGGSSDEPIFIDVTEELFDQLYQYAKSINYSDQFTDSYRNCTLIAYPETIGYLGDGSNPAEENYQEARWSVQGGASQADCAFCSRREVINSPEIVLDEPGRGLSNKSCKVVICNTANGGVNIALPSESDFLGYVRLDVTEQFNDPEKLTTIQGSASVPDTILEYEHVAVDTTSSSTNTVGGSTGSNGMSSLTFKIAGVDFSKFSKFLNPGAGLSSLSIYVDENGLFSSFTFQTKSRNPPESEQIMSTVRPRKTFIVN